MAIYTRTLRAKSFLIQKMGMDYVPDGTEISTYPIAEYEPNEILNRIISMIPEELFDVNPTSVINSVCSGFSTTLSELLYWIYFAKLSLSLNTARYDRLDRVYGDLLSIGRYQGYFYDDKVNVFSGIKDEDVLSLTNVNIITGSIEVTNSDNNEPGYSYEYIEDTDYSVNYKLGKITILKNICPFPNPINIKVSYQIYNYDPNTDETYDYDPYESYITEEKYLTSSGLKLKYINILPGSETIKELFGDTCYSRNKDYFFDYVEGWIYQTPNTRVSPFIKLEISYRTEVTVDYEWEDEKENLVAQPIDSSKKDLEYSIIEASSFFLYDGEF